MKNLSVFQVVLLATFSALAISGILVFALVVGGGGGNAIGPVVIWGTQDTNAFTVVFRQTAENDGRFAQVSYVQKDPATYEAELTNALASGGGPDLFLLRQDAVVRDVGKVVPVSYDFLAESQFDSTFASVASPYLSQSGVLGIPILIDPLVMYWNRDMLSGAGLAQPPQYWGELAGFTERVVKRDDSGRITKAAVAFGEHQNVEHAKDIVSLLILQAGGTITRKDNTERLIPALSARSAGSTSQSTESALRFYTEFADPSKVHYSWNRSLANSRAAFAAGDLALYFGYASEAQFIRRTNPNLNFAAAPVPQALDRTPVTVARVYALATTRTARSPASAITIATLIAGPEIANALSIALGIPPARRDLLPNLTRLAQSGESNPLSGLINDTLCHGADVAACSATFARSWIDPDPRQTDDIFRAMIESVTSGAARYAEAIGRADQQMAQIIGQ